VRATGWVPQPVTNIAKIAAVIGARRAPPMTAATLHEPAGANGRSIMAFDLYESFRCMPDCPLERLSDLQKHRRK